MAVKGILCIFSDNYCFDIKNIYIHENMALLLCAIQLVSVSSQRLDVTDRLALGALASRAFLIYSVIFDLRKVIANSTSKCKITDSTKDVTGNDVQTVYTDGAYQSKENRKFAEDNGIEFIANGI